MDSGKVQVLTAGGAANPQSSSKKKRKIRRGNRKKKDNPDAETAEKSPEKSPATNNADYAHFDAFSSPEKNPPDAEIPTFNAWSSPAVAALFPEPAEQEKTPTLELESSEGEHDDDLLLPSKDSLEDLKEDPLLDANDSLAMHKSVDTVQIEDLYQQEPESSKSHELFWLSVCFVGIMASFVCYGLLLEYTTSGGRELHELSFLFVTSGLYTVTAAAGRYVRGETPTTIPPARFAVLGLTSMGSTFCSVRSLRYVIYPIQVLAKSCKPVPVMLMGALMGKKYDTRKYINVLMIVTGVALFMGGQSKNKEKDDEDDEKPSSSQAIGIILLFISLCFDGGTGAYEDKLMSVHSVQPFDLMYNIQLGKTILAGVSLLVLNQLHLFFQMCQDMGFLLVALGLSGAMGQVFIFVTISKFGALTCSIIGLSRKVTTLVASIYFYGHVLNGIQFTGLLISVSAMVLNFMGKSNKAGHGQHTEPVKSDAMNEEMQRMLDEDPEEGEVELANNRK